MAVAKKTATVQFQQATEMLLSKSTDWGGKKKEIAVNVSGFFGEALASQLGGYLSHFGELEADAGDSVAELVTKKKGIGADADPSIAPLLERIFRQWAVCSSLSQGNSTQFLLFAPLASPADSANLGLSKTPDHLFFILVIAQVNNHALFPEPETKTQATRLIGMFPGLVFDGSRRSNSPLSDDSLIWRNGSSTLQSSNRSGTSTTFPAFSKHVPSTRLAPPFCRRAPRRPRPWPMRRRSLVMRLMEAHAKLAVTCGELGVCWGIFLGWL